MQPFEQLHKSIGRSGNRHYQHTNTHDDDGDDDGGENDDDEDDDDDVDGSAGQGGIVVPQPVANSKQKDHRGR